MEVTALMSEMIAKNIDSALGSKWYGMIAELKNTNSRESHEEKQYWLFLSSSQTLKGIPCKTLNHNGWSVGKTRSTDTVYTYAHTHTNTFTHTHIHTYIVIHTLTVQYKGPMIICEDGSKGFLCSYICSLHEEVKVYRP